MVKFDRGIVALHTFSLFDFTDLVSFLPLSSLTRQTQIFGWKHGERLWEVMCVAVGDVLITKYKVPLKQWGNEPESSGFIIYDNTVAWTLTMGLRLY